MQCGACRRENHADRRFCADCGAPLALACPGCGAANEPGARFCGACGGPLASGPPLPPAAPVPPAPRRPQARWATEGERKQVTVLFADVKGSMELAEQLDAETWSRIMQRFFTLLADGVERFGGFVDKFTGDGIMALFGAPVAHEDHAARACHAALHLRHAVEEHVAVLRAERGLEFTVRIGLNSGEVVVGRIGDDQRMEYTAQGYTVGLANRMEQLAPPGHALLTEHTAALVAGQFRLSDLGARAVKGVRAPVRVFALEDVGELRSRLDVLRARRFSKFVGRARELAVLEDALACALAGQPRVVGIVAAAGVGKTRLCFEFVERCTERAYTVYQLHCPAHGEIIPFQVLQQLVRALCELAEADEDAVARARVADAVSGDRDPEAVPLVLDFLDVGEPLPTIAGRDPEVRQRQLFGLVHRMLARAAARGPIVILVDDMQWIDPGSESFFAEIEAIRGLQGLLIVNFRPEYRPPWTAHEAYVPIPLRPLRPDAVAELLAHLLGDDASLADVKRRIAERSGGNAFFVEELVHSLVEDGHLVGPRGGHRLAPGPAAVRLPASVEVVLAARIDRLPPHAKEVLQAAAVIGKEFSRAVLARVAALEAGELAGALRRLTEAELILQESDEDYAFNHPLTQEVAYREQLTDRRAGVHAAVARAVESLATALDEHYERLAYHWAHSTERERAVEYYARAGDKARAVFSLAMARQQYLLGLALLDALDATPAREAKRVEMTLALAEAGLHGPSPEQVAALHRARTCAERLGDRGSQHRCTYWIGWLEYALGDVEAALTAFGQCIDVATAVGHRGLLAQVYCNLGCTHVEMADYDVALELFQNGFGMREGAAQAPDSVVVAYALGLLGVALGDMGRFDEAFERIQEGLDMLERLGRRSVQASVLQTVTWVTLYRGDWTGCIAAAARSRTLAERVGAPYIVETNTSFEAFARFQLEPRGAALEQLLAATERLQQLRAFLSMSVSLGCCAEALALAGDVARARAYATRAFERVAAREAQGEVQAHRALLIAAAVEGDEACMARHYEAALAAAARKHSPRDAAITELRMGEALAERLAAPTRAHAHLRRARHELDRLGMAWYGDRAAALGAAADGPQASN